MVLIKYILPVVFLTILITDILSEEDGYLDLECQLSNQLLE